MRKRNASLFFVFLFALQAFFATGQSFIKGKLLSQEDWNRFFDTTLQINNAGTIIIHTSKTDIPFPKEWKYTNGLKYRLYSFSKGHYLFMPGNNGVGTYMLYINNNNVFKNFIEMNFMADNITCQQLPYNYILFGLINSEFVQNSDTLTLNRYVITNANGKISSKAILTHGCSLSYNSIDTLNKNVYFNIEYPNHVICTRCLHFNYHDNLLESDAANVAKIKGRVNIDDVHWVTISNIEVLNQ